MEKLHIEIFEHTVLYCSNLYQTVNALNLVQCFSWWSDQFNAIQQLQFKVGKSNVMLLKTTLKQ